MYMVTYKLAHVFAPGEQIKNKTLATAPVADLQINT